MVGSGVVLPPGQVVATGEAYETKAAALKGCESVQRAADGAQIVETES